MLSPAEEEYAFAAADRKEIARVNGDWEN